MRVLYRVRVGVVFGVRAYHAVNIRYPLYSPLCAQSRAFNFGLLFFAQYKRFNLFWRKRREYAHFRSARITANLKGHAFAALFVYHVEMGVTVKMFEVLHEHFAHRKVVRVHRSELEFAVKRYGRFAVAPAYALARYRCRLARLERVKPFPLVEVVHLRMVRLGY